MSEEFFTIPCLILTAVYFVRKRIESEAHVNFLNELELKFYGEGVNVMEDMIYSETPSYALLTFTGSPTPKLTLSPAFLFLRNGESGNVKISLALENLSEHDFTWIPDSSGVVAISKAGGADTWIVTGLSEGEASISVAAKNEINAAAFMHVRVE